MPRTHYPIDDVLADCVAVLRRDANAVIIAPPGAGKTTRFPLALLGANLWPASSQCLLLQPRRVAVRAAARRLAQSLNESVGESIGYSVRFESRVGPRSRLIAMTEGVLLHRLLSDPYLEGVAAILFDEFHERRLDSDLAFAICRLLQQTVRPDLKLVAMSATLEPGPVAAFLGVCATVESAGRAFPVETVHLPQPASSSIAEQTAAGIEWALARSAGDLLTFLPGAGEIAAVERLLRQREIDRDCVLFPLYGDLPAERQDAVFEPSLQRKVVLSTNVAETSITIDGVTAVVDSGWVRRLLVDPATGLNRLELAPISRASADQRAGRAGRTAPGICVRLWSEASHRARPEREPPEIHRTELSGALLRLASLGERDFRAFPWFDAPRSAAIESAESLLVRLGAIDSAGVTPLGRRMANFPLEPRLARLMIECIDRGAAELGALAAAILCDRSPFTGRAASRRPSVHAESDILTIVDAVREYQRTGRTEFPGGTLQPSNVERLEQVRRQLLNIARDAAMPAAAARNRPTDVEILGRAVLAAAPDRLVRRRTAGRPQGLLGGRRGVRLADSSCVAQAEFLVAWDVDDREVEGLVRMASAVEREWLGADKRTESIDVEFDAAHQRVIARRRVRWEGVTLEESPAPVPRDERTSMVLIEAAQREWPKLRSDLTESLATAERLLCLADWLPELNWPAWTDADTCLQGALPDAAAGAASFDELRKARWQDLLTARLDGPQRIAFEHEAPARWIVPSGSRIPLAYERGKPPVLAVRIQELFGLLETPRIARGRVPLLLHLLAPNYRPQQVTHDLASFWKNAYPPIRQELKRLYPKHAWPEDPLTAEPERKGRSTKT